MKDWIVTICTGFLNKQFLICSFNTIWTRASRTGRPIYSDIKRSYTFISKMEKISDSTILKHHSLLIRLAQTFDTAVFLYLVAAEKGSVNKVQLKVTWENTSVYFILIKVTGKQLLASFILVSSIFQTTNGTRTKEAARLPLFSRQQRIKTCFQGSLLNFNFWSIPGLS